MEGRQRKCILNLKSKLMLLTQWKKKKNELYLQWKWMQYSMLKQDQNGYTINSRQQWNKSDAVSDNYMFML